MNQLQALRCSGKIVPDKIYAVNTALGRSYSRYDIGSIVAGVPKEIVIPYTEYTEATSTTPFTSIDKGDIPNAILNNGAAPYTFYFDVGDMDDVLWINVLGITEFFKFHKLFNASIDLHIRSSNPTANAKVWIINNENQTFHFPIPTGENVRIKLFMAKRHWLNSSGDKAVLTPVYMQPVV
tara:strand:+ start:589 stop:1131 length:543 start_codon:yes stop_codon:yes gene_type:complete